MIPQQEKMSVILKEMSEIVLLDPAGDFSAEAGQAAILLSHLAWNEAVGMEARKLGRNLLAPLEVANPRFWSEMSSRDVDAMLDALVNYKHAVYPDDRRRIILCSAAHGKLRVEWMGPVAPGVDAQWEVDLHALVRLGLLDNAVQFLQSTRGLSKKAATKQVVTIAKGIGDTSPFPRP